MIVLGSAHARACIEGFDPYEAVAYCKTFHSRESPNGYPVEARLCMAKNLQLIWSLFALDHQEALEARLEQLTELWWDIAIFERSRNAIYFDARGRSKADLLLLLLEPAAAEAAGRYGCE